MQEIMVHWRLLMKHHFTFNNSKLPLASLCEGRAWPFFGRKVRVSAAQVPCHARCEGKCAHCMSMSTTTEGRHEQKFHRTEFILPLERGNHQALRFRACSAAQRRAAGDTVWPLCSSGLRFSIALRTTYYVLKSPLSQPHDYSTRSMAFRSLRHPLPHSLFLSLQPDKPQ